MATYDYNIRCKMCRVGFNPKKKENALMKLCNNCIKIRKKKYKELNKRRACAS